MCISNFLYRRKWTIVTSLSLLIFVLYRVDFQSFQTLHAYEYELQDFERPQSVQFPENGIYGLTADHDVTFGVDTLSSVSSSIEGNLWSPLENYRSDCWVETLPKEEINSLLQSPKLFFHNSLNDTEYRSARSKNHDDLFSEYTKQDFDAISDFRDTLRIRVARGKRWKMRCLPYAYIIGVPHSGTEDLYSYLSIHPQIVRAFRKEINYWNAKRYPQPTSLYGKGIQPHMSFSEYLDHFDTAAHRINLSATLSNDRLAFHSKITIDASDTLFTEDPGWGQVRRNKGYDVPLYTTARTLAYVQPEARLIVMLREPVSRLYSHYCHVSNHHQVTPSPEDFHTRAMKAVSLYKECFTRRGIRPCVYDTSLEREAGPVSVRSSLYVVYLVDWMRVFTNPQLLVVRAEDYFSGRHGVLRAINRFLDIGPFDAEMSELISAPRPPRPTRPAMLDTTRMALENFFTPFNQQLETVTDREFWQYTREPVELLTQEGL